MSQATGTRSGPYEITAAIGAGGAVIPRSTPGPGDEESDQTGTKALVHSEEQPWGADEESLRGASSSDSSGDGHIGALGMKGRVGRSGGMTKVALVLGLSIGRG